MDSSSIPFSIDMAQLPSHIATGMLQNKFWVVDNLEREIHMDAPTERTFPLKTEFFMIIWVLEGALDMVINLEVVHLKKMQTVMVMPGCLIEFQHNGQRAKVVTMAMEKESVNEMFRTLGIPLGLADKYYHYVVRTMPSQKVSDKNLEMFRLIKKELQEPDYPNKLAVVNRLCEIWMIKSLAYGDDVQKPELGKPITRKEQIFRDFLSLLDQNFRRERSISYYADRMCLTPKYLSTIIREVSGKHGMSWIDEYVALEAKALLRNSEMSVKQVSDQLNFPSQSMFGRFFKKMTGYSPKQYKML